MTAKSSARLGEMAANDRPVLGWFIFGWAFALVAIPVVYIRTPQVPALMMEGLQEGTDPALYERAYAQRLKTRQAVAVWLGFVFAIFTNFIMVGCLFAGL